MRAAGRSQGIVPQHHLSAETATDGSNNGRLRICAQDAEPFSCEPWTKSEATTGHPTVGAEGLEPPASSL